MENNYSDFVGQGMEVGDKFVGESNFLGISLKKKTDGTQTKAGQFLSGIKTKAVSAVQNAKQSGALQNLGNSLLAGAQGQSAGQSTQTQSQGGAIYGTPQGMSTGAKIGIGVGILAVIGIIIWLATKK